MDNKIKIPVSKIEFGSIVKNHMVAEVNERIQKCLEQLKNASTFYIHNADYIIISRKYIIPKNTRKMSYDKCSDIDKWRDFVSLPEGIDYRLPKRDELKSLLSDFVNAQENYVCSGSVKNTLYSGTNSCVYRFESNDYQYWNSSCSPCNVLAIGELPVTNSNTDFITNVLFKYNLVPELDNKIVQFIKAVFLPAFELNDNFVNDFEDMKVLYDAGYISFTDETFMLDTERLITDLEKDNNMDSLTNLHCQTVQKMADTVSKKMMTESNIQAIKERLLNCEKIRADIEPYEERILTDPNRGHWDLYDENVQDGYHIEIEADWVTRNPEEDINEDGVIAIDFGTKSTIVVYQGAIEHSLPMGIGDGEISKSPTPKRYENPTIMEFVNLKNFLKAYNDKDGRPATHWADLRVSHAAADQFMNSKSEEYYAFLHQIKQWAGEENKQFRIKTRSGETYMLPAFDNLKDSDINPIEIYAYYIGLYINNMRKGHGIFLDYYLSFPVTYEKKIRDKITESFTRGLKKSLPQSILHNDKIMKRFHVHGNISEPAAYAVCALQEYGFTPQNDDEIFYAIFDFGGGTTDFDFGLWTASKKSRYDYAIETFGANGDKYLGGENLLSMLAFEIFKQNKDIMLDGGYTFSLTPKCTEFLGSDALLSDSQEAERNMHSLMEELRPYWEDAENKLLKFSNGDMAEYARMDLDSDEDDSPSQNSDESNNACYEVRDEDVTLTVNLFNKDGAESAGVQLRTNTKIIYDFIEGKISEGIANFYNALMLSYQNGRVKKPSCINILLAGNSCKSPIVAKVFDEKITEWTQQIKSQYENEFDVTGLEKLFEIFPPLGTDAAYRKMDERNIPYEKNNFEKPTGKTGVAFGLIDCRKGSSIERIINTNIDTEIPFQCFIGTQRKKLFDVFKGDGTNTLKEIGKPDYGKWYKFIEADEDTFYIYYTTQPKCVNGDMQVEGNAAVKRLKCDIDTVDSEAYVYIRAKDPKTLEYAVSKSGNVDKDKIGEIRTKILEVK